MSDGGKSKCVAMLSIDFSHSWLKSPHKTRRLYLCRGRPRHPRYMTCRPLRTGSQLTGRRPIAFLHSATLTSDLIVLRHSARLKAGAYRGLLAFASGSPWLAAKELRLLRFGEIVYTRILHWRELLLCVLILY